MYGSGLEYTQPQHVVPSCIQSRDLARFNTHFTSRRQIRILFPSVLTSESPVQFHVGFVPSLVANSQHVKMARHTLRWCWNRRSRKSKRQDLLREFGQTWMKAPERGGIPIDWKNNYCKSINHMIKLLSNWTTIKPPALIDRLYRIVKLQQTDCRRAIYGDGNYELAPMDEKTQSFKYAVEDEDGGRERTIVQKVYGWITHK